MKPIVKARPHFRITNAQAGVIKQCCDAIGSKHGRVTAKLLVAAAKHEDHPMHEGYFEWDIKEAAKKHWRQQANYFIRSYYVVDIRYKDAKVERYAIRIEDQTEREYEKHRVVLSNNPMLAQQSDELYSMIRSYCDRAKGLRLHEKDSAWAAIIKAVARNVPSV